MRKFIADKIFLLMPFIILAIGILTHYFLIPNIYGEKMTPPLALFGKTISMATLAFTNKTTSFMNADKILEHFQNISFFEIFWWIWLLCLLVSIFFACKDLQNREDPISENAVLIKRDAYQKIYAATETLKAFNEKFADKDLEKIIHDLKITTNRLNADSDFGYGNAEVIACENSISKHLDALKNSILSLEGDNWHENLPQIKNTVAQINSLLNERTELKKRRD